MSIVMLIDVRTSTIASLATLLVALSSSQRASATACTEAAIRAALLAGGDVDVTCATRTTISYGTELKIASLPTSLEGHGKLVLTPSAGIPALDLPSSAVKIAVRGVEIAAGSPLEAKGGATLELDRVYLHDVTSVSGVGVRVDGATLVMRRSTLVNNDVGTKPLVRVSGGTADIASSSLLGTGASSLFLTGGSKAVLESVTCNGAIATIAAGDGVTVSNSLLGGAISGPAGSFVSLGGTMFAVAPPAGVHVAAALDQIGVPFQLRPLGTYDGGPVPSQPLAPCSPGLNAGAPGAAGGGALDQNGNDRFQRGARDLGAVETAEVPCLTLTPQSGLLATIPEDLATGGEVVASLSGTTTLPVTFFAATSDLFAQASDGDYAPIAKTFTIPAGARSFGIPVSGGTDPFFEDDESFTLTISDPVNATITGAFGQILITNDDPEPKFDVADVCVEVAAGGPSKVDVAIVRTGATKKPIKVLYLTEDGTAKAGVDYTKTEGVSSVLSTDPATQIVSVPVSPGGATALPKSFTFRLQFPSNATLGKAAATITLATSCAGIGGNGGSSGGGGASGAAGAAGAMASGGAAGSSGVGGASGESGAAGSSTSAGAGGAAGTASGGEGGAAGGLAQAGEGGTGGTDAGAAGAGGEVGTGEPGGAGAGGDAGSSGVAGVAGSGVAGSGVAGQNVGTAGKAGTAGGAGKPSGTGGKAGNAGRAGSAGNAGIGGAPVAESSDDGCSFATAGKPSRGLGLAALMLTLLAARARRRRA